MNGRFFGVVPVKKIKKDIRYSSVHDCGDLRTPDTVCWSKGYDWEKKRMQKMICDEEMFRGNII